MDALTIRNLKKEFTSPDGSRNRVIDIPDFSLAAGETMALEGGSGTGKTTLLNLIAGILSPDEGAIVIAGKNISEFSESERDIMRAREIGYVFQTFNLLQGLTALQNVSLGMMFGHGVNAGDARRSLVRVGLSDRVHFRPGQLSVGQQRVAVARAMVGNPSLILADEPTGNLDPANADRVLTLILDLCRENGAALLLVSHDRNILRRFDRVETLEKLNRVAQAGAL